VSDHGGNNDVHVAGEEESELVMQFCVYLLTAMYPSADVLTYCFTICFN